MILTHFSHKDFVYDPNRKYRQLDANILEERYKISKPKGLWLSDESDYGWFEWCKSEQFGLERLNVRSDYEVDLKDILLLDTDNKILKFDNEYSEPISPIYQALKILRWDKLAKEYKGIIITPYSCSLRLDIMWYYGWDCASGCIWDLSAVKLKNVSAGR